MLKFLLWFLALGVVLNAINMILPLPVGFLAQHRWHAKAEHSEEQGQPAFAGLRHQVLMVLGFGFVVGTLVAVTLAFVTLRFVSSHWAYQLVLVIGFVAASEHGQRVYWIKYKGGPGFFGRTGDKFAGLMFSGYFWGSVLSVVAVNVGRWIA